MAPVPEPFNAGSLSTFNLLGDPLDVFFPMAKYLVILPHSSGMGRGGKHYHFTPPRGNMLPPPVLV